MLNRHEYKTQYEYLFHLMNDLGDSDLSIAYFDGNRWSKWFSFMDLSHLDPNEKIWQGKTVLEFIEIANNRSILDIEIVFDFDEDENGSKNPDNIKIFAWKKIRQLNSSGIYGESYFSGSKSIHHSCIFPELRDMSDYQKAKFKEKFLGFCKADLSKKSKRTMIALEGCPHWKTGKIKERYNFYEQN